MWILGGCMLACVAAVLLSLVYERMLRTKKDEALRAAATLTAVPETYEAAYNRFYETMVHIYDDKELLAASSDEAARDNVKFYENALKLSEMIERQYKSDVRRVEQFRLLMFIISVLLSIWIISGTFV